MPVGRQVGELIRSSCREGHSKQLLFEIPVCCHAWRRLVGVGQSRFQKIKACVAQDLPIPRDGRFVAKKNSFKRNTAKRELCVEFLEEIYQTIAEVLPESHARGRGDVKDDKDDEIPRPLNFRKHRGRRPKIASKSRGQCNRKLLRLLPPGSFTDYLNSLRARHPGMKLSLKLFSQVSWLASK